MRLVIERIDQRIAVAVLHAETPAAYAGRRRVGRSRREVGPGEEEVVIGCRDGGRELRAVGERGDDEVGADRVGTAVEQACVNVVVRSVVLRTRCPYSGLLGARNWELIQPFQRVFSTWTQSPSRLVAVNCVPLGAVPRTGAFPEGADLMFTPGRCKKTGSGFCAAEAVGASRSWSNLGRNLGR